MSKSYDNTIEIFGDEKIIKKKIMSITMDSRGVMDAKPDADQNLIIQLWKLIDQQRGQNEETALRAPGYGYGSLKKNFFEAYWNYFAPARAKRAELVANMDYVQQVLKDGAHRAQTLARSVLDRAKKASGLL
jgi:tryptophanyl-tRNA synthetase